jgi:4-amino-4-deoxy-L-arabinose transferase-like glycosyltransferase
MTSGGEAATTGALAWCSRRRHELALAGLVLVLVAFKLRDLPLPYFWDEMGVYGRAALYLYDHRLSLLPAALPAELSRGHPMLLVFVFASLFRVFGAVPLVAHVFMLLVAVGLVVSIFHVARSHFGAPVGLASAALLIVQPIFLAQSTMLLPELPLALAALWTMHFFCRGRHLATALCATVAILIKESAAVLSLVLAVAAIVQCVRSRRSRADAARAVAALTVSVLVLGAFLLVQKHQNGWFVFPLHKDFVDFRWKMVGPELRDFELFVFLEQGRFLLSLAVVAGAVHWFRFRDREPPFGIGWLFVAFSAVFLYFSAANFFMKRYVLCLIPLLVIAAARALWILARRRDSRLVAALIPILVVQLFFISRGKFNYDYDMSFRRQVIRQRDVVRWLESNIDVEAPIYTLFPVIFALEDPRLGYARQKFPRASDRLRADTQYIVAPEIDNEFPMPRRKAELLRTFSSPYMTTRIYRVASP